MPWLHLPPETRRRPPRAPFPTPSLHTPSPISLPEPPPHPHVLLLLLWPLSASFFHLFATVSNIVIREILLGATTRLSRATLHSYKEAHGLAAEIPEDLYHLIKKVVSIRKHLERNRKDKDSKFMLILVESRIHRLARYYKKTKKLPPVWK
ncbi:hypothetical protein Ahy_A03g013866 [Arachis hypogaea]|uniref:Ribosomal protein S13/S15 N-terminal domain-containing protein n=1 Tax=Arachis hypogaea TaxID=3818 RepID=A0A445DWC4_ARAHY|nr:hypothetical protein Ahy_A03g013866 [Arachis hypogaea]